MNTCQATINDTHQWLQYYNVYLKRENNILENKPFALINVKIVIKI